MSMATTLLASSETLLGLVIEVAGIIFLSGIVLYVSKYDAVSAFRTRKGRWKDKALTGGLLVLLTKLDWRAISVALHVGI